MELRSRYLVGGTRALAAIGAGRAYGTRRLCLELGPVCIVLADLDDSQAEFLGARFEQHLRSPAPGNTPILHVRASDPDLFASVDLRGRELVFDLEPTPLAVGIVGPFCMARIDLEPGGKLDSAVVETHAEAGDLENVIENCLRIVVAYQMLHLGGALVHSAGLVVDGEALVFFGHSDAGKTTLCERAHRAGIEVLGDELNGVLPADCGLNVASFPFAGDFGRSQPASNLLPLRAIFQLRQGPADRIDPMSLAHAIGALMACCPFVNGDRFRTEALMDNLTGLLHRIPPRAFTFSLPSQLSLLRDTHESSTREEPSS